MEVIMITTIHIQNIGIIEDITINLNQGLNILTGETGAGKTLIIDSLNILAGGRFSKEMIRKGENHSFVEACIFLPEHKQAIDGNIIISREIYTNGRNMCKINGRLVTVTQLKEFMKDIIDIHGQQDNQTLLDKASHIGYLDSFIGEKLISIKQNYRVLYTQYQDIQKELKENYGDTKEKERQLDLLYYQLKEIKNANLKVGEEEELEEKRTNMLNAEKITQSLQQCDEALSEATIDSVNVAIKALEKIEGLKKEYTQTLSELKNVYYEVQEISRDISSLKEDTCFEEEERQQVEERLDLLFSLKRKYGNGIEEILKYQEELEKQIQEIENIDEINQKRKQRLEEVETQMEKLAEQLHSLRIDFAKQLQENINEELAQLEMPNAQFSIAIEKNENREFHKNGLDTIEFLICTNVGEEAKPLIKIASGGEMSRIMLAIKSVLAKVDQVPIMIFDEIDTGISGVAANSVGQKLKKIAKLHQVICITHLASIAAKGDYNYYISKQVEEGKTKTHITQLDEEETLKEIARIASGTISEITLEHAQELRKVV